MTRNRADPIIVCLQLLLTVGAIVALFFGWKLWFADRVVAETQTAEAVQVADTWAQDFEKHPVPSDDQASNQIYQQEYRLPGSLDEEFFNPVGTVIGILYAPRLGDQFKLTITEGVDKHTVLDTGSAGRYPMSAPLGGAGNSVITAHRSAYGSPFFNLAELRVGDPVYVETEDGWYEYRFRNSDLVDRHQVEVLNDWPDTGNVGYDHLLTLITCNPKYTAWTERLIAYTTLTKFWPRAGGAPADVAPLLNAESNGDVQ